MTADTLYDRGGAVFNALADWYPTILQNEIRGDGVWNDQPGLQELIEYIANNVGSFKAGGGRLVLPPGTYLLEADLEIRAEVSLVVTKNAKFSLASTSVRLDIQGDLEAGRYPVVEFPTGNLSPILFGDGTNPIVFPEWFGAKPGNFWDSAVDPSVLSAWAISDSTEAFKAAVAALPRTGGTIRLGAGQYKITDEIAIGKNGVLIEGGGRQGLMNVGESYKYGSLLFFGADWSDPTKSMLRFGPVEDSDVNPSSPPETSAWGCGLERVSIVQYPSIRNSPCDAAVHVQRCVAFTMSDCTFDFIAGAALKVSVCSLSQFDNIKVKRCGADDGDGTRPAVWLADGSGKSIVQGSVFTGFKVEACYGTSYFYVGQNDVANKFDDTGFEADPSDDETLRTFLEVRGERNHFGKIHFNQAGANSLVSKLVVEGRENHFGELSFHGQVGRWGSAYVKSDAVDNHFDSLIVGTWLPTGGAPALPYDAATQTQVRVYGKRNQFGKVLFGQDSAGAHVGELVVIGESNQLSEVIDRGLMGVRLGGTDNRIVALASFDCPTTALRVTGTRCEVLSALLRDCLVERAPVLEIGPGSGEVVLGYTSQCRVRARVEGALHADEGILVTGDQVELLPGTVVRDIRIGHGLRWTGERGSWHGVEVSGVGKTGYYVEGGTPTRMTAWSARRCNLNPVGIPGQSGHGGFLATTPAHDPVPATCTDFVIEQDGASPYVSPGGEETGLSCS